MAISDKMCVMEMVGEVGVMAIKMDKTKENKLILFLGRNTS